MEPKHICIQITKQPATEDYIKHITTSNNPILSEFKNKQGTFLSNSTLDEFIKDELLHDNFTLTQDSKRKLLTLSSGERKKALFDYLLKSKPQFLVIVNPFDSLDVKNVADLKSRLLSLSQDIPVIQFFSRKDDILHCIQYILRPDSDTFFIQNLLEYLNQEQITRDIDFKHPLPKPISKPTYHLPKTLIELKKVNVTYNDKLILKDICWAINQGEFWELKGANGTGKSTLVTMMIGDNPKAYGQDVYLFGNKRGSGETVWDIKRHIGYFTPSMMHLFNGQHSALNMVISGLKDSIGLYQIPTDLEVNLAKQWLELIGLNTLKHINYYELSETDKRLILICRAMIKHPPLILLDEPTVGLDDKGALLFIKLVQKIAKESNSAVLYVSHKTEPDLKPTHMFQLEHSIQGSVGKVKN
ncbi:ABC transporter-like protein [Formosa agariphila KMM 3901]|uniref:ABC transporter-like protein n=1 Tax=Formosa agariphila (strain DSM 15362 / KCTC 12365 / LMG 23005 / KMM 3901 / M-2Alg 35-1) TaxID=1347342 RepID=T2KJL2_FORAG|nr:ATP-binding cassette domain-containing protein [Formosa agariphila]CDF78179.1 ABC transporter-like protein [Formosa agariphila KMM 3901]